MLAASVYAGSFRAREMFRKKEMLTRCNTSRRTTAASPRRPRTLAGLGGPMPSKKAQQKLRELRDRLQKDLLVQKAKKKLDQAQAVCTKRLFGSNALTRSVRPVRF